jgi:hypothetical protein
MLRRVVLRLSVSPSAELLEFAVRLIRCYPTFPLGMAFGATLIIIGLYLILPE